MFARTTYQKLLAGVCKLTDAKISVSGAWEAFNNCAIHIENENFVCRRRSYPNLAEGIIYLNKQRGEGKIFFKPIGE